MQKKKQEAKKEQKRAIEGQRSLLERMKVELDVLVVIPLSPLFFLLLSFMSECTLWARVFLLFLFYLTFDLHMLCYTFGLIKVWPKRK